MGLLEENIRGKMAELSISRQVLARVNDMHEGALCRGLKNIEPLSNPEVEQLNSTLDDLMRLRKLVAPFELPTSDVRKLRILLIRFRDGDLDQILNRAMAAELAAQIASAR